MDRHRFDADPDPIFHFDVSPGPDPTPNFTHVEKSIFLKFTAVPVYIVLSFWSVSLAVIIRNISDSTVYGNLLGKKCSLA